MTTMASKAVRPMDNAGPMTPAACLFALTVAVALMDVFFRPFLTALIFDEVARLAGRVWWTDK
jgi:hypothetical protein